MDTKEINKIIGYGIALIFGYFIISQFIGFIVWGVVGLVVLRICQDYQRRR